MSACKKLSTLITLLLLQTSIARPDKSTAPAVFEVINEQAKTDEKRVLPYQNPLAGSSAQNAYKLHAQHQQAMFNAERVRQHRAQLLRWNTQHPKQHVDSYMKAYQESQENHHLALENSQSNPKERKVRARQEQERTLKDKAQIEPARITRSDAVNKNRNHRSFGSIYTGYHNKQKIYTYPGPTYDQGVTIKPNGNVGLYDYAKEHTTLYTEAVPSKSQYIYPKLYSQTYAYQSSNDINTLSNAISQPSQPSAQLSTLVHTPKVTTAEPLHLNSDLYFLLKDSQFRNEGSLTSSAGSNNARYVIPKDYTPITEEVDDIEDDRDHRIKFIQPEPTTLTQAEDYTTTTTTNYYKVESEQSVNDANKITDYSQDMPNYASLRQEIPLQFYQNEPSTEGIKYLKTEPTGVQHLSQDGTGVSAYGDDDIHYAANYEFGYRVRDPHSGNDYGHKEAKSGDKTQGHYHVLLPDGRMQQVRYSAGPEGFHADISYDHLQTHLKN